MIAFDAAVAWRAIVAFHLALAAGVASKMSAWLSFLAKKFIDLRRICRIGLKGRVHLAQGAGLFGEQPLT